MSIHQCPKGHASTESDYCSECGTKIEGISKQSSAVNTLNIESRKTTQNLIDCPACTALHDPSGGSFCEICGYNFSTGAHGEVPPIEDAGTGGLGGQGESVVSYPTSHVLEINITVDPSLRSPESPEAPNQPPIILRLDKEINLIGRRSELRNINPEIALNFDSAVSHRHALINRQADETFTLRDLDSANGTTFHGVELTPMVDAVLKDGDEFTLGHWTRIKVKFVTI